MKNRIEQPRMQTLSVEELTLISGGKEIEGYNIWYGIGYVAHGVWNACCWLVTSEDYKASETLMNCI